MAHERLTRKRGGMLRYRYEAGGCMGFSFNSLAEVGEPYQPWFREEIARRGWVVEYGRDLDERPWVADFLVSASSASSASEK